jgi:hypothetical protein
MSSALLPNSDIARRGRHFAFVPEPEVNGLFDYLVGQRQQVRGKTSLSVVQLGEQSLGFLKIERVEAFCEPPIDRGQKFAGLDPLPLITP